MTVNIDIHLRDLCGDIRVLKIRDGYAGKAVMIIETLDGYQRMVVSMDPDDVRFVVRTLLAALPEGENQGSMLLPSEVSL